LAVALVLLAGLIAITGIDLDHQIIPDVLSIPGIAVSPRTESGGATRLSACWWAVGYSS
jgi:hypothetical protein